jgi:hypothetical protein
MSNKKMSNDLLFLWGVGLLTALHYGAWIGVVGFLLAIILNISGTDRWKD